jgi:hypothetical protein
LSTHAALDDPRRVSALSVPTPAAHALLTAGLAAIICLVAFTAEGGLRVGRTTPAEIGLILGGGVSVCGALLLAPRRERFWGLGPLALLLALAVLTALSITWAATPSEAWLEANRTLAYTAVFAGAVALAHSVPGRWSAVVGAITLSAVVISAYAVLTKIFPGALNPDEIYARLREPFGYWNSVGLAAALGVPGCLWLATRRTGHQALNALAYPALGLLVLTMLLSFSRGAVLAAVLGAVFWIVTVPTRRLRAAAVLIAGGAGGVMMAAWAFGQSALTDDRVPVDLRNTAGLQLGLLVVVTLGLLTLIGLGVGFARANRAPTQLERDRAGVALLVTLALAGLGGVVALSLGDKGLTGSISGRWHQLTDASAPLPRNDNSRLTSAGSVRARYWDEALRIFADNPGVGVGAGGYAVVRKRYRTADPAVRHAHGYVVQTLADLGLAGAAVSLALLAAGWLAGRGPLAARSRAADPVTAAPAQRFAFADRLRGGIGERPRAICAAVVAVLVLVTAWTVYQPQRADTLTQDALDTLATGNADRAREQARHAREINPLSLDPLYALWTIEASAGRNSAARAALERAVRLQPANPDPWVRLAEFELNTLKRPKVALTAIRPALYLDPRSSDAVAVFLAAQRKTTAP